MTVKSLKFALHGMGSGACVDPTTMARIARRGEEVGFESLWVGEHVVLPAPRVAPSPMEPDDPILDPAIALTFIAANTTRVKLGTGIIIMPQRNPLVLAKELASVDVLSNGRLIFGIGVGYLEPEFAAVGAPFADKGARTDDYLAAMRAIWSDRTVEHRGEFSSFGGVRARPLPVQRPHPPIVVGGRSRGAYRRSVEQAHGWYGWGMNPRETAEAIADIQRIVETTVRPPGLGPLEISMTPPMRIDRGLAEEYAAVGVHRLILQSPHGADAAGLERFVEEVGRTLIS
jgi:probable F420-dependent oxidoreductase